MNDDVVLNCRIVTRQLAQVLIEADLGQAWFYESEFSVVRLGNGIQPDRIRISEKLAIQRGIT